MNSNEARKAKQNNKTAIFEKLMGAVTNLKIGKATINFKIGIIKFLDDYSKTRKYSVSLHFLKNNFKTIKEKVVCREHASEFQ